MNKLMMALLVAVGVSLMGASTSFAGCGNCGGDKAKKDAKHEHSWCAKCGETDKDKCCKEGAEKCDKCKLDKGSPGCKHACAGGCT